MTTTNVEEAMLRIEGGEVRRVHTLPTKDDYLVSTHTFNMLHLLRVFFPEHYLLPVVSYIMDHDVPEKVTGDTPWAAKYPLSGGAIAAMLHDAEQPVIDEFFLADENMLTDDQKNVVSFLDRFEFFVWASLQVMSGNRRLASKPKETRDLLTTSVIYKQNEPFLENVFDEIQAYTIAEETEWWDRVVRKHDNGGHNMGLGRSDD